MQSVIQIHPRDNVLVALQELKAGDVIHHQGQQITLGDDVPRGHKIALHALAENAQVIKYGQAIGHTLTEVGAGEHLHAHNVKTNLSDLDRYDYEPINVSLKAPMADRDVILYRRPDGQVGVRNELWIVPTVGCVNGMAKQMIKRLEKEEDLSAIDGVHLLEHTYGCSQLGNDHLTTRTILQDMVKHPNAGGVLVVGLGCENNQIDVFKETLGDHGDRVRFMICQDQLDEVEYGVNQLKELLALMKQDERQAGHLSELRFGLECGGSDGFSGITANPLLGAFSDYLISNGGTTVLTEVPEMFGAERLLMSRCKDQETFEKLVAMINDFKSYFIEHKQPIYENPSPGNKAGGISTLEDKSLGCTQKSGQSQVIDVLHYGERLTQHGLNLLSAPGNDAVATSALAAAGCHMVLFTTGRGTPYGGPVPTMKIATNTDLANRKPHWIDFNAGALLEGVTMDELLTQFIDKLVTLVNGQPTRNEVNEFKELAIFKLGVTL
ncbi:UxaA family hydrolase [Celerinatantimonas diazotrophica]|nr:altronate dehydratase family protein [Celerinatantimonas diazotrophica]